MGKGDKRTKKGKIFCGSYGKSRPKNPYRKYVKQRQQNRCYNCGCILIYKKSEQKSAVTNNNFKTKEHIPQQSLYEGYNENYKKNRITVPCCLKCNNYFSKIDSDIRDLIGIKNENNKHLIDLSEKAAKSIMLKSNWKDRVFFDGSGRPIKVEFSYSNLKELHIKNFKGLFRYNYGFNIPHDYKIEIIADGDTEVVAARALLDTLEKHLDWQYSGHQDIFSYIMSPLNDKEGIVTPTEDLNNCMMIAAVLDYHRTTMTVILAVKDKAMQNVNRLYKERQRELK